MMWIITWPSHCINHIQTRGRACTHHTVKSTSSLLFLSFQVPIIATVNVFFFPFCAGRMKWKQSLSLQEMIQEKSKSSTSGTMKILSRRVPPKENRKLKHLIFDEYMFILNFINYTKQTTFWVCLFITTHVSLIL